MDRKESEWGGRGESAVVSRRSRIRRGGLFRDLICASRGPGPTSQTRDDAVLYRGCIIPDQDASNSGATEAPGMS